MNSRNNPDGNPLPEQQGPPGKNMAIEALIESNARSLVIMNSIDAFIYIADMQTYELLFVNEYGRKAWGSEMEGTLCYKSLQGLDSPCSFCTNNRLLNPDGTINGVYEWEFQNRINGRWYEIRDRAIQWTDGRIVRLEIATDITQKKTAEIKLRESEEKYRSLIDSSDAAIMLIDPYGQFLYLNAVAAEPFNRTPEELAGANVHNLFPHNQADSVLGALRQVIATGCGMVVQTQAEVAESRRWLRVSVQPVRDDKGIPVSALLYCSDISEAKAAEDELRKFRTISDEANYGLAIASTNGILEYSNDAFARMHNREVSELLGNNLSMLHNAEQMVSVAESIRLLKEQGEFKALEIWRTRKDGSVFPSLMNAKIITQNGIPQIMAATVIDISAIKNAEESLRRSEERLNNAQEIANMASWDLNLRTMEIKWSDNYYRLAEKDKATTVPTQELFMSMVHPDDRELVDQKLAEIMESRSAMSYEFRLVVPDGRVKWIHNCIVPSFEKGELVALSGVNIDVTEKKRSNDEIHGLNTNLEKKILERTAELALVNENLRNEIEERKQIEIALKKARLEAERANHAKSEFLSRMSHELRTPMNSILGFAQLLERSDITPGQQKWVNHILHGGKHLLELINEVLDISRIEAGRISLSLEPVHLRELLSEMAEANQPQAFARHIHIWLTDSPGLDLFVQADRQRLKQVLLNLLNNAIKYNIEGGTVHIITDLLQVTEEGQSPVRISVTDTGSGIAVDDLPRIFLPFERIGAEKTATEGTGLGLSVVKKLMDLMGGKVGVESKPGQGSTFWIELHQTKSPLAILHKTLESNGFTGSKPHYSGTILYIEDNISNIELVAEILESTRPGIRLITSTYGRESIPLAVEYKPDIILLDLDLPDIQGLEVLVGLLADHQTRTIPVVILSADAMEGQIEKCRKAGAANYLVKPIEISGFLAVIDNYTGNSC
jgi:PAS domain S-box-containing protein